MVVQIVRASIKPDQRDRWLDVIQTNAAETRAEEGCEGYQIAEDIEAPNNFVIVEHWTTWDAQYDHLRNQFEKLMTALDGVMAGPPEVSVHEVAATKTLEEVLAAAGVGR